MCHVVACQWCDCKQEEGHQTPGPHGLVIQDGVIEGHGQPERHKQNLTAPNGHQIESDRKQNQQNQKDAHPLHAFQANGANQRALPTDPTGAGK